MKKSKTKVRYWISVMISEDERKDLIDTLGSKGFEMGADDMTFKTYDEEEAKQVYVSAKEIMHSYYPQIECEYVHACTQPYCPKCGENGKFSDFYCRSCGTELIPKEYYEW